MRRGEQRKTTQPRRSQADRGQHERQTAARRHAKGSDQTAERQQNGAGRAMERVLVAAIRQCDAGEQPGCPLIEALSR